MSGCSLTKWGCGLPVGRDFGFGSAGSRFPMGSSTGESAQVGPSGDLTCLRVLAAPQATLQDAIDWHDFSHANEQQSTSLQSARA